MSSNKDDLNFQSMRLSPIKQLGQHFLRDKRVCERIAQAIPALPGEAVVEIGPGEGALTEWLVQRFQALTAIELDSRAAGVIRNTFPNVELIEKDFLKIDFEPWKALRPHLCGNLPYYITSPILFRFLDEISFFRSGVFMMQKEVAERLIAKPRTKEYGILAVQTQLKCSVKHVIDVAPGAFYPPPKVWSSVVLLTPDQPETGIPDAWLKKTVRTAFNQRRKTLRNSLKAVFGDKVEAAESMNLGRRAEELEPEEFIVLAKVLHE